MILPLHALALQGGWTSKGNAFDLAHEIAHQQAISHHHEDDGSIHYDESTESAKHLAEHECCQQTATLPSVALPLLNFPPASIAVLHPPIDVPDGFPKPLQRPPSALG